MQRSFPFQKIFFALLISLSSGCFWGNHHLDHLHNAEEFEKENRFDDAIAEYRLHMDSIKEREHKETWDNPSFYRLKIGDLKLQKSLPEEALQEYLLAEKEGIQSESISYRIREVAKWYRDKDELDKAFELLSSYRSRDPLLFNALLDDIARERTEKQFQAK